MNRLSATSEARADDLRTTPFGHLLLELFDTRSTGTILVYAEDDSLAAAIRLESGRPAAVLAAEQGERRIADILMPLCSRTEGRFEFLIGQDLVGDDGLVAAGAIDPLPMVMAATRVGVRQDLIEQVMKLVSRSLIKLTKDVDLKRYAFNAEERLVLRGLDQGAIELDDLRAHVDVPDDVLGRVLYVLRITRGITLLPLQRTVSGMVFHPPPLTSTSAAPSMRPSEPSARMPSRQPSAPVSSQPSAPAPSRQPSAPVSRQPSASVSRQPSAPVSRQPSAPVSSPRPGTYSQQPQPRSTPASPRAPSLTPLPFGALASEAPFASRSSSLPPSEARTAKESAEALWQQAKTLSRREQHEAALRAAHSAVKLLAPSPGREAFLGWLIYQHDGAGPVANTHVWKCLNRALKRDPLCEEALYYKGLVLARTGETEQAQAHFERVLMLDPKHGGAEREVRVYEMRRGHEREQSGFLRRLLSTRPGPKSG
jgi:hypothetical protein